MQQIPFSQQKYFSIISYIHVHTFFDPMNHLASGLSPLSHIHCAFVRDSDFLSEPSPSSTSSPAFRVNVSFFPIGSRVNLAHLKRSEIDGPSSRLTNVGKQFKGQRKYTPFPSASLCWSTELKNEDWRNEIEIFLWRFPSLVLNNHFWRCEKWDKKTKAKLESEWNSAAHSFC